MVPRRPASASRSTTESGADPCWGSEPPSIVRNSSGEMVARTGRSATDANQAEAWRCVDSRRLGIFLCAGALGSTGSEAALTGVVTLHLTKRIDVGSMHDRSV